MHYCQNCGTQSGATAKYCHRCGQALAGSSSGNLQGTLAIHTLLGNRYMVTRLLGQGGMGAVYLAQDRKAFGRQCVIKEMLAYYQTPAEQRKAEQDFEREARFLANLRHDSVPQIYEYFIEQGRYYLVMEYVVGDTLEELLEQSSQPLTEKEALRYTLQLANTLVYLADQTPPVIHRDIKPANIIVDQEQGRIKLVDFGLAKENSATPQTTGLSAPLGTPGYAPPEQYSGNVEPRTDVYALGATLHHLLTSRDPREEKPFDYPPIVDLMPNLSPDLSQLVAQMVEPKSENRPHATEVVTRLEELIQSSVPTQPTNSGSLNAKPSPALNTQPFAIRSGPLAYDATELAEICDDNWSDGIYHLYEGHFEPWLESQNRHDLAARSKSIRNQNNNRSSGLEEFLRAANPTLALPSLAIDQMSLNVGKIERGTAVQEEIRLRNQGRGCLSGTIEPLATWATVYPANFELQRGQEVTLKINLRTQELDEGIRREPLFTVKSNGGQETVTANLQVTWQPELETEPAQIVRFSNESGSLNPLVTERLMIRNQGGGTLRGRLQSNATWLSLDRPYFQLTSGQSMAVQATARFRPQDPSQRTATVRVITADEDRTLTAYARQKKDWYNSQARFTSWLLYLPALLLVYFGLSIPPALLATVGITTTPFDSLMLALIVLFVAVAGVAFYGTQQLVTRLDEIEAYYYVGDLAASIPQSIFAPRNSYLYALVGGLYGVLVGWHASPMIDGGSWIGLIAGVCAGATLGATGTNSPTLPDPAAWTKQLWQGSTLYSSLTIGFARSAILAGTAAILAILLIVSGNLQLTWFGIALGAMIGLTLSTENHHWLTLRARWLLGLARQALWVGVGTFMVVTTFSLLAFGTPWNLLNNYGSLSLSYPGFGMLLWNIVLIGAGMGGGLGAFWLLHTNETGQRLAWSDIRRIFPTMTSLLVLVALPIHLIVGLLFNLIAGAGFTNWALLLTTSTTVLTVAWFLRERRSQMEQALQMAQTGVGQSSGQLPHLAQSTLSRLWQRTNIQVPPILIRLWQKIAPLVRQIEIPGLANFRRLPTLTELEQHATLTMVLCSASVAVLLVPITAQLVTGVIVGIGLLIYYLLWIGLGVWFILFLIRRARS